MSKRFFAYVFIVFFISSMKLPTTTLASPVVVLDPGHGGYDSGIRAPGIKEKEITLSIVRHFKYILETLDREVHLTRKIDHYLSLEERRKQAYEKEPGVFISLHLSDSEDFVLYTTRYEKPDRDLSLEEYYSLYSRQRKYLYESGNLASAMSQTFKEQFDGASVVRKEMSLPLLSTMGVPAIMIELPSRGVKYDEDMLLKAASSLMLGLLNYEQRD